jgi:hypothetical protein
MNALAASLTAFMMLAGAAGKKMMPPSPSAPKPAPAELAAPQPQPRDTLAIRTIQLDPLKKAVHKLRLVPGVATTIQLPEPWKETPICGECVFADAEYKGQLFRLDLVESTQTMTLKNARLPGGDAPPEAFITNLDITLAGGATVTFFVELTPFPEQADTRVEITLPEDAKATKRQTAFDREMAQVFEVKLAEKANEAIMKAALHGTKCKDFSGGPRRTEQMVVRLGQLCKNGRLLWITFEVENRDREDLVLSTPSLSGANGVTSTSHFIERESLLFNERTRAIVAAELVDPSIPPSTYTLEVVEDGGKSRTVSIGDITF